MKQFYEQQKEMYEQKIKRATYKSPYLYAIRLFDGLILKEEEDNKKLLRNKKKMESVKNV